MQTCPENKLFFFIPKSTCLNPCVSMANHFLFCFLFRFQNKIKKSPVIIESQIQISREKNSSAQNELTRKTNTNVFKLYRLLLFLFLPLIYRSIVSLLHEKLLLLQHLTSSRAEWNTWFILDTFSVSLLPLTHQLCNVENRSFAVEQ